MVTFIRTHPRLLIELFNDNNTTNLSPITPKFLSAITRTRETGNIPDADPN